jgi:hypothetical protein
MSEAADSAVRPPRATHAPWLPLIVIVLAQLQMAVNISALPVSLGPISEDLGVLDATAATPEQVREAVAINEDARLLALQASFLIVAGISSLAIFPAARLPRYAPGELSAEDIVGEETGSGTP